MYLLDVDCRYAFANEKYLNRLGKNLDEIIGHNCEDHMHPDIVAIVKDAVKYVIETGKPYYDELNGTTTGKYYLRTFSPVRGEHGNATAVTVSVKDISERKNLEEELRNHSERLEILVGKRTAELEVKNKDLEEMNIVLKILLQKRHEDKSKVEESVVSNIKGLVLPYLAKLQNTSPNTMQNLLLGIIETNINELLSPLLSNILQYNLTPKEIQVATMVKDGKTTKEIATILGVETGSIHTHRNSIRKKLCLSRSVNLQSKLHSLG